MRKNHPNFRRDVKNLWKNYQRGKVDVREIQDWFWDRGIHADVWEIPLILKTNIPSRIFSRIGRAAKKKDKLVWMRDFRIVYDKKSNPSCPFMSKYPDDYHLINFLTKEIEEIIFIKKEVKLKNQKGEVRHTSAILTEFKNI